MRRGGGVRGEFGLQSDGGATAGVRGGRRRGRLKNIRIISAIYHSGMIFATFGFHNRLCLAAPRLSRK